MSHVELDAFEERSEETEADWLLKVVVRLGVLFLRYVFHLLVARGSFLLAGLLRFFAHSPLRLFFLDVASFFLLADLLMHLCYVVEGVFAVIGVVDVPGVVLQKTR